MFQCKEFLKFYEDAILPEIADAYYNLTIDYLYRFDSDIAAFEADRGDCEPPIEYWKEKEPFQGWHDAMHALNKATCQIHFYYGMQLFHSGTTLEELNSAPTIPDENLKQIHTYAILDKTAIQATIQALNHCSGDTDYMNQWYKYHVKNTELHSKAYVWAGYLVAQKEAEVVTKVELIAEELGK